MTSEQAQMTNVEAETANIFGHWGLGSGYSKHRNASFLLPLPAPHVISDDRKSGRIGAFDGTET